MELKGLGFVPLLLAFWCAAWLATSYIVTVVLGHAASPLMHISDVGNFFPENILLRIGFIGTSIGTLVLTFLIYKYMVMHTEEFRGHQVPIQRILLAIVWASCFGTAVMHVLSPEEYPRIHFVSMSYIFEPLLTFLKGLEGLSLYVMGDFICPMDLVRDERRGLSKFTTRQTISA
ncbi:DNA damage-regulated autophagy modulator protein 1-like [Hyla sarda]|uniref:DNA damage-regulated autophagy modulator protein 1-like n=1 Tax=Hyla sarda TaxID=327740 RepID=UPI0024C394E5|nr:DNA damage-regulated autophagy modulator protein 1-like [Hyla sarda]